MIEEQESAESREADREESEKEASEDSATESGSPEELQTSLTEANDKYVRLYADFENYKKIAARNKEELLKYANEDIISDILTVADHLELALEHANKDASEVIALAEGVDLTLKELRNVLEKHGVVAIDALKKPFDPTIHHAMSQIETDDAEENTVIKEFRKGYMFRDRVLRAAMVGVAKKPGKPDSSEPDSDQNETVTSDEHQGSEGNRT